MFTKQMTVSRLAAALAALNFTLMLPQPALSADAPAASAADTEELGEVVITGSRLATGFDMPTPVAVYSSEELAQAAPNNMAEALGQLPSLGGSVQASTSGQGSGNSFSNGQSLLNLRQLGANRTLVLLDGQRMGVTNVRNSVDIGVIPQNLVKRVDIVTGGASASYGSDAVAGAVNFVLDTEFQGLKTELTGGQSSYRDNKNGKFSIAYGKAFSPRARIVAAGEYFKMGGMNYGEETGRYWFDHPTGALTGAAGTLPKTVLVPDARATIGSFGGTISAVQQCPAGATGDACRSLVNQRFAAGGTLVPFAFGVSRDTRFAGGGDGAITNQPFTPDTLRRSLFLHGEFDVSPSLTLWGQGTYNSNVTFLNSQVSTQLGAEAFTIQEGNAYLPTGVSAILNSTSGSQTFSLQRYDLDMGPVQDYSNVIVRRLGMGAKGRINDRWTFDTTMALQETAQILDLRLGNVRRLYAAADAVVNPTNGQVVCRSSYYASTTSTVFLPNGSGMDPGCVPLDLYGPNKVSKAAADYVMGVNTAETRLRQTTFDLNVRGDFGENIALPAGPISFASGLNYRRMTANRNVDALSAIYLDGTGVRGFPTGLQNRYGGYQFYNPAPLTGRVTVTEGYAEFGVPLLKDLPLAQSLAATIAGRLSDYSQSGVENMWKLGLNWTLNNSLRFRGTISADTRAPTVLELFDTGSVTRGGNRFPNASGSVTATGQTIATGNTNLTPEHARTYTAGFVLSPSFIPKFQASLDWYKIKLTDQISQVGAQGIIDRCNAGDQSYCKFILVNGLPVTTTTGVGPLDFPTITNPYLNQAADVANTGLDFAAAYNLDLGAGRLALRLTGNYLLAVEDRGNSCPVGALGPVRDYVGSIGNDCGIYPKITARTSVSYEIGRFGFGVTERYIDKGKIDPTYVAGIDISFNDVPAVWYTDLNADYALGKWYGGEGSVFLNVTNAFNKDPPVATSSARSWVVPTNFGLYDVQGRRYVAGMRFNW